MTFHVIGPLKIRFFFEHGNFSVHPAEILDSNMVLLLSTISLLISIVYEYIPDIHDQGKMLVLPNQLLC